MDYSIVNDRGDYYAGCEDGAPVWSHVRHKGTRFDEQTADLVLRQLKGLGFDAVEKKEIR